jgi:hypothetical protein
MSVYQVRWRWELREKNDLFFRFSLFFYDKEKKEVVLCGWSKHTLCYILRLRIKKINMIEVLEIDEAWDANSLGGKARGRWFFYLLKNVCQALIVVCFRFLWRCKKKKKKTGKKATASSKNRCPTEEEREEARGTWTTTTTK